MASYNKIILIGHLGDDPTVREFEGKKVANFSVATNAFVKPNEEPRTDWFRVSFWGNNAEVIERYLKKGNQVYIEGRLSTRTYRGDDGQTRFSLDVQGQNFTMLGTRNESGGGENEQSQGTKPVSQPQPVYDADEPDDLPF